MFETIMTAVITHALGRGIDYLFDAFSSSQTPKNSYPPPQIYPPPPPYQPYGPPWPPYPPPPPLPGNISGVVTRSAPLASYQIASMQIVAVNIHNPQYIYRINTYPNGAFFIRIPPGVYYVYAAMFSTYNPNEPVGLGCYNIVQTYEVRYGPSGIQYNYYSEPQLTQQMVPLTIANGTDQRGVNITLFAENDFTPTGRIPHIIPNYLSNLNATVTALRVYESGANQLPPEHRAYIQRFARSQTRYIWWELNLAHPTHAQRLDFTITAVYHRHDGSVFGQHAINTYVMPEWTASWHTFGSEWNTPGNWTPGSYRVDVHIGNAKVASTYFNVYEDYPAFIQPT